MNDRDIFPSGDVMAVPNLSFDLSLNPPVRSLRLVEEIWRRETHPEIHEIVSLLEHDPVTTIHLLRQVNSPIYALKQSVASIDRAATMLGFDSVANTIFVESHIPKADELSTRRANLAYAYLIASSVTASYIAWDLAHELDMERPGVIRTAALIHQVGRMALLSSDPQTYLPLWTESTTPSGKEMAIPPGIGREIVHFRTDYTRYGEGLAKNWHLPPDLAESIRYHADPERTEDADRHVVLVVAVSQYAARTMFEKEEHLDRDQSGERLRKVAGELAETYEVSIKAIENLLEQSKKDAYQEAIAIEL